jgi:hypothetical protein
MATGDLQRFQNVGTGPTAAFNLFGGKYGVSWQATLGGGNLQLQVLAGDGTNWLPVGSALAALGYTVFDLAPGQYRFNITTSTNNYIVIAGVPYRT